MAKPKGISRFRTEPMFGKHLFWGEAAFFLALFGAMGIGVAIGLLADDFLAFLLATMALCACVALAAKRSARVDVGSDGVHIRWNARSRFVRHIDIEAVNVVALDGRHRIPQSQVELETPMGTVEIPVSARFDDKLRMQEAEALAQRIEEARLNVQPDALTPPIALGRGDEETAVWVKRLQSAPMERGFRTVQGVQRLWRVVEDDSQDSTNRAAAAIALGPRIGASEIEKIERIARATAAPALRVALVAAAHREDENALVEALEEVERESHAG